MARQPARLLLLLVSSLAVSLSCSNPDSHAETEWPIRGMPFDSVFRKVGEFRLEESEEAPITGVYHLRVLDGGRLLVTDRAASGTFRIFKRDGALIQILGRFGQGPGEFKRALDACEDQEGSVYVADAVPRITRFTPGFVFDTVFGIPAFGAGQIETLGTNLVVSVVNQGQSAKRVFLLSRNGEILRRFHEAHPLIHEVPYWISFFGQRIAVGTDRVFVSNDFLYPLYTYDAEGNLMQTFGTPPGSWVEAPRPERGAFVGPTGFQRLSEWLRSFTVIRDIGVYRDSVLVVTHARHSPAVNDLYLKEDVGLDLYDLEGRKLFEDIPPEGKVLRVEDYVYLQLAEPPAGWIIGVYELRDALRGIES